MHVTGIFALETAAAPSSVLRKSKTQTLEAVMPLFAGNWLRDAIRAITNSNRVLGTNVIARQKQLIRTTAYGNKRLA